MIKVGGLYHVIPSGGIYKNSIYCVDSSLNPRTPGWQVLPKNALVLFLRTVDKTDLLEFLWKDKIIYFHKWDKDEFVEVKK